MLTAKKAPISVSLPGAPPTDRVDRLETFATDRVQAGAAAMNRDLLRESGVFSVCLVGGPGCGKTTLLHETLGRLKQELRIGVVVCNLRAQQDAEQLRPLAAQVVPIEAVDLKPSLLYEALRRVDLSKLDVLFIERGAGSAPRAQDLGHEASVALFSACGGNEKIQRELDRVEHADVVLLTKSDLVPFVGFSRSAFHSSVREVNRQARIIEVCSTGCTAGLEQWCQWVRDHVHRPIGSPCSIDSSGDLGLADYFFG